ncbi:MAG TPA: hypothetical protein VG841_15540 [Caulobacterales bacterium]|nr:hypothetical protein [Caulobacterales bacterium]
MIVWSGWGIVVVLIALVGAVVGVSAAGVLSDSAHLAYGPSQSIGVGVGGILASVGIFLFARAVSSGEPRIFIDEATGQRIEVRKSAGSLFFIPTRFWAYIVLALTALVALSMYGEAGPAP